METRSGTTFVGNSTEHFVAFERLKVAVKVQEMRQKINAVLDQLVEDLQLDIHTCVSQALDPSKGEITDG